MQLEELKQRKVLISPLNWGSGHVARCIGLIFRLLAQENEIVVACNSDQERIFKEYFPNLVFVSHEGYPFKFRGKGQFASDMLLKYSALRKRLRLEKEETEKIVKTFEIDVVISDHRYGFYSDKLTSIFLTHQYNLPTKWYQAPIAVKHKKLMRKFSDVWVLDTPDNKLAGYLSGSLEGMQLTYVGPISRFEMYAIPKERDTEHVAIISGPHVYAQQFASSIVERFSEAVFICDESIELPEHVQRISGSWKEQDAAILRAKHIISRSGYSTIMDVEALGVSATYIPTPGQAEQEYLQKWHSAKRS